MGLFGKKKKDDVIERMIHEEEPAQVQQQQPVQQEQNIGDMFAQAQQQAQMSPRQQAFISEVPPNPPIILRQQYQAQVVPRQQPQPQPVVPEPKDKLKARCKALDEQNKLLKEFAKKCIVKMKEQDKQIGILMKRLQGEKLSIGEFLNSHFA